MRAFTSTQAAEVFDADYAHGLIGHKKHLTQYIRNQKQNPVRYKKLEPRLLIFEKIEIVDQSTEIEELKRQRIEDKKENQKMILDILKKQGIIEN